MTKFLLDTNVLILLILGRADLANFGKHKRLDIFDRDDLTNLETTLHDATGFVTLPYIMAEFSNLINISKASISAVAMFERFISQAEELDCRSEDIIKNPHFRRLGLTDAAIIQLARGRMHVLTVDHALFGILSEIGINTTNLRHRTPLK